MNKLIPGAALAVLLAALAAGGWWAHEEGRIGKNPRAPLVENFRPIVDAWAFRKGELKPKCISAATDASEGNRRGRPGWVSSDTMGLGVTTLSVRMTNPAMQLMRDKTLLRFDALSREGFFKASETEMQLDTGETVPAREYVLTQKGWENSYGNCFYPARPEVLDIVSFSRIEPDPDGIRTYEIVYKVGIRSLPDWAGTEDARAIFGDMKKIREPEEKRLRLVRAEKGWLPESLVKSKDGVLDTSRLNKNLDDLLPLITPATILDLGKDHEFLRDPSVCLQVPQHTGRDADAIEWSLNGPVSITMLEPDPTANPVPLIRESWLPRMMNLARAGVFREEALPRDEVRNRPAGIRYVLDEKYLPHISKSGPGCLRITPLKVDILPASIELQGRQDGTLSYNFKAIGRIAEDAWVRGISWSGIPEMDAYLSYGVPITGSVEFKDGKWRLINAGAAIPVIVELPKIQKPNPPPMAGLPAAVANSPLPASASGNQTQTGSVHVIAVYKAKGASGSSEEGTIRIAVGNKAQPVTLVLSAYDPVHWIIQPDAGARIVKVIVMGNTPGRATGISQEIVQRSGGYLRDYRSGSDSSGRRSFRDSSTADTVERLVGRRPDSIDGMYETHFFSIGSRQVPPPPPVSAPAWKSMASPPAPSRVVIPQPAGVQPRAIGGNSVVIPMPQDGSITIDPRSARAVQGN